MPCFHFSIAGEEPTTDFGVELADTDAAKRQAVVMAGEMLADAPDAFWSVGDWRLDVTNCDRQRIFCLTLACESGEDGVTAHHSCPEDGDLPARRPAAAAPG